MIYFVGAGPGASDLLTIRAVRAIEQANVIIWASSLVSQSVLEFANSKALIFDSAGMTLEDVTKLYSEHCHHNIVRLHCGDISIYGALYEQMLWCDRNGIDYEIVPGVSSLAGACALAGIELTVPQLSQSVILTRFADRTSKSMPSKESVSEFAKHGTTMAIFLSGAKPKQLQDSLLADGSGYSPDTPACVVVRASWEDERFKVTTLANLAKTMKELDSRLTCLVIVGPVVTPDENNIGRSHLYSPNFSHTFRKRSLAGTTQGRPSARRTHEPELAPQGRPSARRTHEPELAPQVAQKKKSLRSGWTTGACACAAAKAATLALISGQLPNSITITLPKGTKVDFKVESESSSRIDKRFRQATVVKDAGDDPDCTDGARITVTATLIGNEGALDRPDVLSRAIQLDQTLYIGAGEGVGTVTKPGLGIEVNKPAINPVPRSMITKEVREITDLPIYLEVSVPGGVAMAQETTNDRLGIVGGISILGTTGVVKPFSTAAYRASIVQQLQVASQQGENEIILATGHRSEKCALAQHRSLDKVCFVEVGDFIGIALRKAASLKFESIRFYAMSGKIAKIATGIMMTHFHRSEIDTSFLQEVANSVGASDRVKQSATETTTARHFYETCIDTGETEPLQKLCYLAKQSCLQHISSKIADIEVSMVDYEGVRIVADTLGYSIHR